MEGRIWYLPPAPGPLTGPLGELVSGLRLVSSRLDLVQVSDTIRSASAHDSIGEGELPFSQVWAALTDLGYSGPVVIETLHPDDTSRGFVRDLTRLRAAGWT